MSEPLFDRDTLRATLREALPDDVAHHGEAPEPKYLYVPHRHRRALELDHPLVVGIRGAGKSVWWSALQSETHRELVAQALPDLSLGAATRVYAGFGEKLSPRHYPDKRTLAKLLEEGRAAADIWRTVVTHHFREDLEIGRELESRKTWSARVEWMVDHPEEAAMAFAELDERSQENGSRHLVLFDALDRCADDWPDLLRLLKGLLELLLEMRSFRYLRAKAFVRPDMLEDPRVTSFRDASKILAGKIDLRWSRADLYGLLFQRLGNAPQNGETFRNACGKLGSGPWDQVGDTWRVPRALREDEDLQRKIFHEMAGPFMGNDRRRGFPYTWLPNHLADAADQVSPRSFLAALREASEHVAPPNWTYALHFEGIKQGVQEASRIRVDEVREDFPWISPLMEPLSGLVIPCAFEEIAERWRAAGIPKKLSTGSSTEAETRLAPKHLDDGLDGLREDLLELALFSRQPDGRINMPDVYRVGFGLGRKGGVKPIR